MPVSVDTNGSLEILRPGLAFVKVLDVNIWKDKKVDLNLQTQEYKLMNFD